MVSAFISSVQRDFGEYREAAKQAVESLGLRAVMAEAGGASPDPSRTALLARVDGCDVLILIIGSQYGSVGASGRSPTEDEFDRAVANGIDVLAFVQEGVEREPEQDTFLRRVRGTWEQGVFAPGFRTPAELGFAIVRSIRELQDGRADMNAIPAAAERALDLARGDRRGGQGSGCPVRVAFVPVGAPRLLDAATLEQPGLGDHIARIVRDHALVSQAAGLEVDVRSDGITAFGKTPQAFVGTTVVLASDGAVHVEADARAEGIMGGSAIVHDKVVALVEAASLAAQDLWAILDPGGRVRQVVATLGVPDASMKVYAMSTIGNSMSMPMSVPESIVAPDPPITLRRNDVGTEATTGHLVAALRRTFLDLGAVHDR